MSISRIKKMLKNKRRMLAISMATYHPLKKHTRVAVIMRGSMSVS
jgi:hypothetical protein